jgi:DNA processing protein
MAEKTHNQQPADGQLVDVVRLAMVHGVGPRIRQSLLERFRTPGNVLAAPAGELRLVQGVGAKLSAAIVAARQEVDAEGEIARCQAHGIGVLVESSPEYPRLLKEIPDPPGVLFCRGALQPQDALSVAIVGTRHATQYGRKQAELLAAGLSRAGLTIVSGLARGIDAAAHRGALSAGGRTIAFLGSGVLNIYPPEHKELAREVMACGALLSESPAHRAPIKGTFPQRNRLITGMSLGLIVVEAAASSGALISARHAMEQNREVFAVPGRIDSRVSQGCHRLIRDGAKLVQSIDDVLEELGPLVEKASDAMGRTVHHPAELVLNELERQVLDAIGAEPTSIDDVARGSGLPIHRVLSTLSVLEMRRVVRRVSGQLVMRV